VRLVSLFALVVAQGAYLWLQAALMSGLPLIEAHSAVGAVLTQSHYGRTWLVATTGLLLAVCGAAWARGTGRPICALGVMVYAAGKIGASHAADAGDFSLPEFIHWVHVCATAWWAGSIILAVVILRNFSATSHLRASEHLAFAKGLSLSATIAFTVVIASGV
jgi:putative copper resistance protein D